MFVLPLPTTHGTSPGAGGGVFLGVHLGTDRVENTIFNSSPTVVGGLVAMGTCLFHGRYIVTGLHDRFIWLRM
jgi:hypothetical protein